MRTEAVASGDVDVLPHDLFEVSRYSRVREEVVGYTRREIDEQVHIAVGSVLRTHDRTEHRDVDNAALTKFDFVRAELREDVREERHTKNLLPRWLAYNTSAATHVKKVDNTTALIWKPCLVVEQHFRKLNASHFCIDGYNGVLFHDGLCTVNPTRERIAL